MPNPPSRARILLTATSAAVGGLLAWWHWRGPALAALAITTGALLLLAVFAPRAYAPVFRVLDLIVHGILQTITWTLLGLVFVIVFIPGHLVLALRRSDPLDRRPTTKRTTAWHEVRPSIDAAKHFRAQF